MKKFNGPKKISIKVNSHNAGAYKALAETMPGSKKVYIDAGLIAYLLPDGTSLELYSEGAVYPAYLFSVTDLVISYKVESLENTLAALEKAGAQLIGNIEQVCVSYRYCHIMVNEQHILGIFEEH